MPYPLFTRVLFSLTTLLMSGCLSPQGFQLVPPENLLIYQSSGAYSKDWFPPGLEYEDIYFKTPDGVLLHGWYCPAKNPRAYVLFCHGNAANIAFRYPDFIRLTKELGVTVFAFDYRGYGRSEGVSSEKGLMIDARAAREWLAEKEKISEQEIVLFGRSLGGGVAVDLAANEGARGLILESTFTSLPDVANDALPLWPGILMVSQYNSLQKIKDYHGPLLIAHGKKDQMIPFEHGRKLFQAANEPKKLVSIQDAGHNWSPPKGYLATLDDFFNSLPR